MSSTNPSIQFLRGTNAKKTSTTNTNTVLAAGQPFYETDTNKLYVGDGATALGSLKPIGGEYSLTKTGSTIYLKKDGVTVSQVTDSSGSGGDGNYYHSTGSWSGLTYTATANGGAPALSLTIPTGTTSTTVAKGDHTHAYLTNGTHSAAAPAKSGTVALTSDLPTFSYSGTTLTITSNA